MKKLLIVLLLTLTVSCSNKITVERASDGYVTRVLEAHHVTKPGDTVIIRSSERGYTFYGRYKGLVPKSFISKGNAYTYDKFIRIR